MKLTDVPAAPEWLGVRWISRRACAVTVSTVAIFLALVLRAQDPHRNGEPPSTPAFLAAPKDVAKPPADAKVSASGIATKILKSGDGTEHPSGDDCVVVRFVAWKRDGTLFSTSGAHHETAVQCLPSAIPGIAEVTESMVVGESRRIWAPGEMAFAVHFAHHGAKKMMHTEDFPKLDLTFDLELVGILKAPTTPPDLKTPPASAFRTPSGVAMEILKAGSGTEHPTTSSRVKLNYTLWTADGKLFESTVMSGNPASVLVGLAIPGWRETVPRMVVGEKARIWVPASLGYGDHPRDKLVAAGDLVYDVELLEILPN